MSQESADRWVRSQLTARRCAPHVVTYHRWSIPRCIQEATRAAPETRIRAQDIRAHRSAARPAPQVSFLIVRALSVALSTSVVEERAGFAWWDPKASACVLSRGVPIQACRQGSATQHRDVSISFVDGSTYLRK